MKGLGWLVLVTLVTALLGACGASDGKPVPDPETGVRLVLDACWLQDYEKASRYFVGGRQGWQSAPGFVRQYLDHICDNGRALTFTVDEERTREKTTALQVSTFADQHRRKPLRTQTWHFVRAGKGWAIEKVE